LELHRQPRGRRLYVEIAASPEATIYLRQSSTGSMRKFDVRRFQTEPEVESDGARIEFLDRHKVWVQGQIVDSGTGRPTPVRLAFRSKDGRYLPPYGHRADVNAELFQDFGGDLKLEDESFAYVDGNFQIELPVGEVYVDISKGFEYERVRRKIIIDPNERELHLEILRSIDLRKLGWVTADTHVHVLSTSTALLETQAEGVNLINLLAAQIGKYFINVGDLAQGQLVSGDGEVLIRMGTENR